MPPFITLRLTHLLELSKKCMQALRDIFNLKAPKFLISGYFEGKKIYDLQKSPFIFLKLSQKWRKILYIAY